MSDGPQRPAPPRMVIGWHCGHWSITAGPYVDMAGTPASCGHGCTMRAEYEYESAA